MSQIFLSGTIIFPHKGHVKDKTVDNSKIKMSFIKDINIFAKYSYFRNRN